MPENVGGARWSDIPCGEACILLVAVFVVACGLPEGIASPTPPPLAAPATAAPAIAAPTAAPSPTMPPPTVVSTTSVVPQAQLNATQEAYCRQPSISDTAACMAQRVELPTPLAVPFAQALQQFTSRALLYASEPGLMLGDPNSGASLWISGTACPRRTTRDIYGEWSADGQFIALICQDLNYQATIHLLDMQTAAERQIAQGDAADFAWSPQGHHLLVAEQTDVQRAFLLDAATGATAALPAAPLWQNQGYPPPNVGQAVPHGGWYIEANPAAMAFSPDGLRIAVIGDCMCLLDADLAHARDGKLTMLMTFEGGFLSRPRWSHDGHFVYTVVLHQNHDNTLSPSSMYGAVSLRTEISTGVVTSTYPADPVWSPDEKAYLTWSVPDGGGDAAWALYQADGTLIRALTDPLQEGPFWTPDSQ